MVIIIVLMSYYESEQKKSVAFNTMQVDANYHFLSAQ